MDPTRTSAIQAKLQQFVSSGTLLGGAVTGFAGSSNYQYAAGFQDLARTIPFNNKTIVRLASDSKLMGTVAFLKLIDKGIITGLEPIKTWIPAFANTQVISPISPSGSTFLSNPFQATTGSNILKVSQHQHGFNNGNLVAFQGATGIEGIPSTAINQIFPVTVLDHNNYSVTLAVAATGTSSSPEGGIVSVYQLPAGSNQVVFQGITYYYQLAPLKRDILIWHVLTHTLGYLYNVIPLGSVGGYVDGRNDPERQILSNIQGGIFQNLLFPAAFALPIIPGSYPNIQAWAQTLATVPLLFQPGEQWTYGPVLSLLGALTEIIDGRPFEKYFSDEITAPLGMTDTGFFIYDDDPNRANKLARIQDLPLAAGPYLINANTVIPHIGDYFYATGQPRNLPLIDGGMYSTLDDRTIFYTMLLNNGKYNNNTQSLISPAIISALSHNRINDIVAGATAPPLKSPKWGLGVAVIAGSDNLISLFGQTTRAITWSGFFNTQFTVDFGNGAVFNYVTNVISAKGPNTYNLLNNLHMASLISVSANEQDASPNAPSSVSIFE